MNPYSHLILASQLEQQIAPDNLSEYYWGAVAPDIRYPAGVPRAATHLPPRDIAADTSTYPQLSSFLQGYLVHCLTDEIPLEEVFLAHLPFSLYKNKLTRRHLAVILELYNFENLGIKFRLSGTYNKFLAKIGLEEVDCTKFAAFIRSYLASPTSAGRIAALTRLSGMEDDPRIEKYVSAAERFQRNGLFRTMLFWGIRAGKINTQLTSRTSAKLKAMVIR